MRILHLDSGHEMRGGQWQVLRLIEGLRGAGHESLLLARAGSPLLAQARPGDTVRFRLVDPIEAVRAWRRLTDWLHTES